VLGARQAKAVSRCGCSSWLADPEIEAKNLRVNQSERVYLVPSSRNTQRPNSPSQCLERGCSKDFRMVGVVRRLNSLKAVSVHEIDCKKRSSTNQSVLQKVKQRRAALLVDDTTPTPAQRQY
jgi:hypothetical protein